LPKIAVGVVAAVAAGYLLYKTIGGDAENPEEEKTEEVVAKETPEATKKID